MPRAVRAISRRAAQRTRDEQVILKAEFCSALTTQHATQHAGPSSTPSDVGGVKAPSARPFSCPLERVVYAPGVPGRTVSDAGAFNE